MHNLDITYKDIYSKLAKRTEKYATDVRGVFLSRMGDIAKLCEGVDIPEGAVFHFNDYPEIADKVQKQLRSMYSELYQCVRGNITREWYYANDDVDRLVKAMFGKEAAEDKHFAKYFQRNKAAMDSFFARKSDGMDLSQRIWKYVGEAKEELELALDLSLGEGMDADAMSRRVRKYLQDTDKLFRRVRNKHGELVLSKAAKAYHPGQGKYRSSYKNAMRLTRTETNMAYRTADITRWQQLPFIRGYEVKLSHNHKEKMPHGDICDTLKGIYPVYFLFKGWHPHCFCYIVPLLCTDKELEELTGRILEGTEDEFTPANVYHDVPDNFKQWMVDNNDRLERYKSLPYFVKDNYPNGDYTKDGNWLPKIHNEAGAGNVAKMLAEKEIDLAAYNKVQAMGQKEWEASSNYLPEGSEEASSLLEAKSTSSVNSIHVLDDSSKMDAVMKQATLGTDAFGSWITKEELAQLEHVAKAAKFVSKQEGKFVIAMPKTAIEAAVNGKAAKFGESLKLGTNYSKVAQKALAEETEQAMVVVRTPAGSRYVQTMAGKSQQAVLLPNTKYKVVGQKEKVLIHGGKSTKVVQYELELVDDGSSFIEQLVKKQAVAQKSLAEFNKAKHAAQNVIKASNKGDFAKLGIDTLDLEEMLVMGKATAAEIKAKTKELAKALSEGKKEYKAAVKAADDIISEAEQWADYSVDFNKLKLVLNNGTLEEVKLCTKSLEAEVAAAKQSLTTMYGSYIDNPVEVFKTYGKDALDSLYASVDKKMKQWLNDPYHPNDLAWLKKKLEFEIDWVKNKKAYETWQEAVKAYEKQLSIVNVKIKIGSWQSEVDAAINFAATTKSKKVKQWVDELQQMLAVGAENIDTDAVRARLDELDKEMKRLLKARKKVVAAAGTLENLTKAECERIYQEFENSLHDVTDAELRDIIKQKWKVLTDEEKYCLTKYTRTFHYLNEPLRGIPYLGNETGYADDLPILTSALNKMEMPRNLCVRRGVNNFPIKELSKDLSQLKAGDQFTDGGFLSTACHPHSGFFYDYNMVIAVPKGAKGVYAEPFTYYNDSYKFDYQSHTIWDGKEKVSFGAEMEWIGQRGARFEVVKIVGKTIYLKLIAQLT